MDRPKFVESRAIYRFRLTNDCLITESGRSGLESARFRSSVGVQELQNEQDFPHVRHELFESEIKNTSECDCDSAHVLSQ